MGEVKQERPFLNSKVEDILLVILAVMEEGEVRRAVFCASGDFDNLNLAEGF